MKLYRIAVPVRALDPSIVRTFFALRFKRFRAYESDDYFNGVSEPALIIELHDLGDCSRYVQAVTAQASQTFECAILIETLDLESIAWEAPFGKEDGQ